MLDAARRACELAQGEEVGRLDPETRTALALTRLIEILGEAAKNVTAETQARFPEIPWHDIADTRNRIIHQYFDVDYAIIEAIIRNDLPPLIGQLEAALGALGLPHRSASSCSHSRSPPISLSYDVTAVPLAGGVIELGVPLRTDLLMTPLLKTYLERIRGEHKKLDARGVMQMHRQVDMALDEIYVTLNASIKRERTGGLGLPRFVFGEGRASPRSPRSSGSVSRRCDPGSRSMSNPVDRAAVSTTPARVAPFSAWCRAP